MTDWASVPCVQVGRADVAWPNVSPRSVANVVLETVCPRLRRLTPSGAFAAKTWPLTIQPRSVSPRAETASAGDSEASIADRFSTDPKRAPAGRSVARSAHAPL